MYVKQNLKTKTTYPFRQYFAKFFIVSSSSNLKTVCRNLNTVFCEYNKNCLRNKMNDGYNTI